ncbi:ATP-binding cassette domain-containing protein [Thiotrichales bacterium 19S9-12]|nr:ATP-binding cassette domain-containing protein [Thiotrichales bacterium 19S9-11]MCF6811988.1 ATP-binding cassette domain-containing protein [Thiotrichales bacterium 19S9-12]
MIKNNLIVTFLKQLHHHITKWYDKKTIIGGLILPSFVINILALIFPLVLLQVYDRIIPNESTTTLFLLIILVFIAVIIESFLKITRTLIISWADARFDYKTNQNLFNIILRSNLTKFETYGVGVHMERMRSVYDVKNFYGGQVLTSTLDIPFILIFLALIFYIGSLLVLIPIITLSILILLMLRNSNALQTGLNDKQSSNNRRMSFLVEIFRNIHTVKTLSLEPFMLRRYERLQDRTSEINYELSLVNSELQNNTSLLSQFTVILIVTCGALYVMHGDLTVGGLAACTLMSSRVLQPIGRSIGIWHRMGTIRQAEKAIQEFDELKPKAKYKSMINSGKIKGYYQLSDIFIQAGKHTLFENLSLTVKRNETLAITGSNLSGKSTLLSILAGLVKPDSGEVLLDDELIEKYDAEFLAEHIAYLPQHSVIFHGSIIDNMTMYRPELNEKALLVAKQLGFDIAVNRLPNGFETILGDSVTELLPSGVNQLITISRALLTKPSIMLLDETNTSLDLASDNRFQQIIKSYKGKLTIVMVTHRPSLLKLADRRVEIKNKALVEVPNK